ncbi:MAG: hypothetical protein WDN69_12605 [Aliidongia sp.]
MSSRSGGRLADTTDGLLKPWSEESIVANVLAPLILGVAELEKEGLAHRGINPANIFFRDPNRRLAMLGDCVSAPPGLFPAGRLRDDRRGDGGSGPAAAMAGRVPISTLWVCWCCISISARCRWPACGGGNRRGKAEARFLSGPGRGGAGAAQSGRTRARPGLRRPARALAAAGLAYVAGREATDAETAAAAGARRARASTWPARAARPGGTCPGSWTGPARNRRRGSCAAWPSRSG